MHICNYVHETGITAQNKLYVSYSVGIASVKDAVN